MAKTHKALFPILPSTPIGMARLAAEATHADDGHLIEFKAMKARSIMNYSVSKRMGWTAYSINPYRGCEFGCKYCYARYTHQFLQPASIEAIPKGTYDIPQQSWALAFEREIYIKENAAWLLEQELRKLDFKEEIAIGTATDPYQPIERRTQLTRSLLQVLARHSGRRIGIVSKSALIARDIDVLTEIARRNHLVVHLTITTTDAALARLLEPRAPRPDLRFNTVRKLRQAGITAGVLCSPLLPGINDSESSVGAVAERAAAAGACFLSGSPLFLKSCSRPTYLSFVREHFPHLAEDYARRFASRDFAAGPYRQEMRDMVRRLCARYGLNQRSSDALLTKQGDDAPRKPPSRFGEPEVREVQARLFA